MILLFWGWLLITGLALGGLWVPLNAKTLFLRWALTPFFSMLLPCCLTLILCLLHEVSSLHLWTMWGACGVLVLWRQRHEIRSLLSFVLAPKGYAVIIYGSLLVMLLRNTITSLWPGDGMIHWGRKAMDWYAHRGFTHDPAIAEFLKSWNGYPIYHSLTQWVSLLALPYPFFLPIKAINFYDGFCLWGIVFAAMAVLSITSLRAKGPLALAVGAVVVAFGQRPLVEAMGSGYADLQLTYLSVLLLALTVFFQENFQENFQGKTILLGLVGGVLCITKQEGIFRFIGILSMGWCFLPEMTLKKIFKIALIVLLIKFIEKAFHPVVPIEDVYTGRLFFSPSFMLSKFHHMASAFASSLSLPTRSFSQSSLLWSHLLLLILLVKNILKKEKTLLFWYPLGVYAFGLVFNLLPDLISSNSFHKELQDPQVYASMILIRLQSQLGPFLMLALVGGSSFAKPSTAFER